MALLEGKTPGEKKKIIAAAVLGVVSLLALYMAFGGGVTGGSTTTASVKSSPTPTPKAPGPQRGANDQFRLPSPDENALNLTVPVTYNPGNTYGAPDPGRNIFAFYEPPPPTPFVPPTPTPPPPPPTPTPPPPPPFTITAITPTTVYAGTKGSFKLQVYGDKFTPDAKIYFNQSEMPTTFVSPQSLTTTLTENLVRQEGAKQIIIQTPDGRFYSMPMNMNVVPPPKPTNFQYIGMIGRARYNNDTAYFLETGKPTPFGARLNDVIGTRFRVINISASEVMVEDTQLGFKHPIPMATAPSGTTGTSPGGGFIPYNPGGGIGPIPMPLDRNTRPQPQPAAPRPATRPTTPPSSKDDVDDNDNP